MRKRKMGKEDIKYYRLCAFPLFGAVSGIILYAFSMLCGHFGFGYTCFALIGSAIPALINGGASFKGFMDTSETISNVLFQKRKPEGQKDNCIGANAVTVVIVYFMLYAGGMSVIWKEEQLALLGIGYIISGTLYSMAFVWFSAAGKGQPSMPAVQKRTLRVILSIILALCFCTCIAISPIMGMLEALLCMWVWTYYYYVSKRVFGGITEPSAGYFLLLCELAVVLFIGLFGRVLL